MTKYDFTGTPKCLLCEDNNFKIIPNLQAQLCVKSILEMKQNNTAMEDSK